MTHSHLSPYKSNSIITHTLLSLSPTHDHTLFQVLDILSTSMITVSLSTLTTLCPFTLLYCLASPLWTTSLYCIAVGSLWIHWLYCIFAYPTPNHPTPFSISFRLFWSPSLYPGQFSFTLQLPPSLPHFSQSSWHDSPSTIVPVSLIPINPPRFSPHGSSNSHLKWQLTTLDHCPIQVATCP